MGNEKIKIINGSCRRGEVGTFYDFFQYGSSSSIEGMSACAIVRFDDGMVDFFGLNNIQFVRVDQCAD